jgi:hypothetical protein
MILVIVYASEECRRYYKCKEYPILVLSDYENLVYFTTTKILNYCQAWLAQELAGNEFKILYSPENLNGKLD